jgi:antitoxin HigA-1
MRIPNNRKPTHPGEMLREEFLSPMNMTQKELADAVQVPYQRINEIVAGKRGVTSSTALRLAKYFGNSPDFWLNLQTKYDLFSAQKKEEDILKSIKEQNTVSLLYGELTFKAGDKKPEKMYVVYKDEFGKYRWRYVGENGRILADSAESYISRVACENGIRLIKSSGKDRTAFQT